MDVFTAPGKGSTMEPFLQEKKEHPKTALITGASRGIGRACAEAFAEAGYSLLLTCSRSMEELVALTKELSAQYGGCYRPLRADMGNIEEVVQVFSGLSSLDVLINNAGISYVGLLSEMSPADWRRLMAVNLDSCFYACKYAIPLMLKKHSGKIINVSSVWGSVGASMEVAYSASKGAVNAFTRALAKELAPSNIQVNAVACGVIDTSMNACFSKEELEALKREIPADRLGTPQEAAALILQTAQAPSYMTGQIITIDGGWC